MSSSIANPWIADNQEPKFCGNESNTVSETWTDITSSNDTANMIICGITDCFSYFATVGGNDIFIDGYE